MSGNERVAGGDRFVAEIDRGDGWWMIHVLNPDVVTQAARWSEVEPMARGVIVAMLDLDEDASFELEIVPVFDDEADQLLRDAEELEEHALSLAEAASAAKQAAVRTLRDAGWTLQGIAAGLGLSYQRIEQIVKAPQQDHGEPPEVQRRNINQRIKQVSEAEMRIRSARTGRYVRSTTAARNPRTTVRESAAANAGSRKTAHRSAITGRYVTKSTAARHPNTTVTENSRG